MAEPVKIKGFMHMPNGPQYWIQTYTAVMRTMADQAQAEGYSLYGYVNRRELEEEQENDLVAIQRMVALTNEFEREWPKLRIEAGHFDRALSEFLAKKGYGGR